jgi:hypothetical protein
VSASYLHRDESDRSVPTAYCPLMSIHLRATYRVSSILLKRILTVSRERSLSYKEFSREICRTEVRRPKESHDRHV